jgi:hypothetical protein
MSYITTTKCEKYCHVVVERERSFCCCSSRFQDTWKWGKTLYPNCFLYVPTTKHRGKKTHLVLGCNHISHAPKSNRCGPKIHESSSTFTQYTTTKSLFSKLGSWQKSQATRGENMREARERERETHTHTHTHTLTT